MQQSKLVRKQHAIVTEMLKSVVEIPSTLVETLNSNEWKGAMERQSKSLIENLDTRLYT